MFFNNEFGTLAKFSSLDSDKKGAAVPISLLCGMLGAMTSYVITLETAPNVFTFLTETTNNNTGETCEHYALTGPGVAMVLAAGIIAACIAAYVYINYAYSQQETSTNSTLRLSASSEVPAQPGNTDSEKASLLAAYQTP